MATKESGRKPAHKALVDAIIDGEIEARALSQRAAELGPSLSVQMMKVVRAITIARNKGKMDMRRARELYFEAYQALSLAAFARVAHEVVDVAQAAADAVYTHASNVEDLKDVAPIRKADFMERELEKAAKATGE